MSTPREIHDARRLAGAQFRPFDWDDSPDDKVEAAADFDPYFTDTDGEPGICPTCNGSGEGMFDGTGICPTCNGSGAKTWSTAPLAVTAADGASDEQP